jgi:hypothetical protein
MGNPPRPTFRDPEVIKRAVEGILPDILRWPQGSTDEDVVRADLISAAEAEGKDIYRIARHLDDYKFWAVNEELIRVLEALESYWIQAELDVEKAWVKANKITPTFEVGAKVSVPHRGDRVVGVVTHRDLERGVYLVNVKKLGHVREGLGCRGLIIGFENAQAPD